MIKVEKQCNTIQQGIECLIEAAKEDYDLDGRTSRDYVSGSYGRTWH